MAGKATSVYVSIVDVENKHKLVEFKKFFQADDANKFIKENEEKYPKPRYYIFKEIY